MSRNDITGKRYGKLTAIYPTDKKKGKHRIWCFKCDCGNLVERTTHHLNKNSACDQCNPPYSGLRKDYTGQRFGRLVALECTGKHSGKEYVWRLQCDCGNIVELGVSRFIGGHTRSCGCLRKETAVKNNPKNQRNSVSDYRTGKQFDDLTGKQFGELTVVALAPTEKNRSRRWLCKCSCGKELVVGTKALLDGKTLSCGCVNTRLYCVYKHIAPDGRVYIGITSRPLKNVCSTGNQYKTQTVFHKPIDKFGGDDLFGETFSHYFLNNNDTWKAYVGTELVSETNLFEDSEAERLKRYYICEYHATDPQFGLNSASGGHRDYSYSDDTKKRQSATRTGKDGRTDWRVYIHENKINHKRYIGVTCRDPVIRWARGKGYRRSSRQGTAYSHFYNAIEKYGWDGFEHTIVAEGLTKFQAAEMEKALIAEYDTTNPERGYNVTRGGDGTSGARHTEETKQTLSVIAKNRVEKTGIVNFKGQHHSEDTKAKLRDLMTGRYDGNKNPFAGKHHTEETRQKLSDKQSQPVNQYDMQGRFIRQYGSASEASAAIGVSVTSISYASTGKTRFAGNYLWKKTSEEFPAGVDVDPTAILGNSKHTGQKKRVRQFTKEGTLIKEYASLKDAAEAVGANVANISAAAYGRTKTCRGFIWMFSD